MENIRQKNEKNFIVDVLFVLALFAVFAISALVLVSIGADVYQHTVNDMNQNYESRAVSTYLSEKIRQCEKQLEDGTPAIQIGDLNGTVALVLMQEIDGELYGTYLYYHDGFLRELFVQNNYAEQNIMLNAGSKVLELEDFSPVWISENLLSITMTTATGQEHQLYLTTHCGQGGGR